MSTAASGIRAAVAAAVLCVGCGAPGRGPVVVAAASSLTSALEALADEDPALAVTTAGSQVLAAQVRAGAPVDVVVLADPAIASALADEGHLGPPRALLANRLALATAADRAGADAGLDLLLDASLVVVLPLDGVPLRTWTDAALAAAEESGLLPAGGAARVLAGADSFEADAATVLQKVALGEADAAIVYASDAAVAPDGVDVVALAAVVQPTITYTVQLAPGADRDAERLVEGWLAGDRDDHWRAFGLARA